MKEMAKFQGKKYWRSLEQLADKPEFRRFLEQEFPSVLPDFDANFSRRNFLGLMGASFALAGLAGCRRPLEKIIPYVQQPEEIIPGVANYYATTIPFGLSAYGVIVECHEGRPTKIEGNRYHSSTKGKSSAWLQAEILNLYDPDRSDKVLHNGKKSNWDEFVVFWREQFDQFSKTKGEGLAVLTEEFSSPTLSRLRDEFLKQFPKAQFVAYNSLSDTNMITGVSAGMGEGSTIIPQYDFSVADVILAIDSDFLLTESEAISATSGYFAGRKISPKVNKLNRLYVVEPGFTTTGAMADHRLRLSRSLTEAFVLSLIWELKQQGVDRFEFTTEEDPIEKYGFDRKWLKVIASDLIKAGGRSLVVAGRSEGPKVHKAVAWINMALRNVFNTFRYYRVGKEIAYTEPDKVNQLIAAVNSGRINTLVMMGNNPAYNLPLHPGFDQALKKVKHTVNLSSHVDETSKLVEWHLPRTHPLESWGDAVDFEGTESIIQPMIEPLLGGQSDVELLDILGHGRDRRGYDIVRETWQQIFFEGRHFEKRWRGALHHGFNVRIRSPKATGGSTDKNKKISIGNFPNVDKADPESIELIFQASPSVYDGRFANNGWLQELPHPITKLTWDNAACMNVKTAKEFGISKNDVIEIEANGNKVELPVWIVPGMADFVISVDLGYGRTAAGKVGTGIGVDVNSLRSFDSPFFTSNVKIVKTGKIYKLASTQDHGSMEGRPIVREAPVDYYLEHPEFAREMVEHPPLEGIYKEHDYGSGYQWGMTIDLSKCVSCNACTIACQSENNIPVVGKDRVAEGREMHWIRLDRYYTGDDENPEMVFQPVACQHCENAPCEEVCPVQATSHDKEGLNVMTYNRCIGTRYCSNNCPYKVRRFNFFNYTKDTPEIVRMVMNPDVTVRSRGVMEKCTFCTQRINRAKIKAKKEGRSVTDGEIVTACQQACPAGAISFGNINDKESQVNKLRAMDRSYELLAEFNTKPRNTYLARIRNPHSELMQESEVDDKREGH